MNNNPSCPMTDLITILGLTDKFKYLFSFAYEGKLEKWEYHARGILYIAQNK